MELDRAVWALSRRKELARAVARESGVDIADPRLEFRAEVVVAVRPVEVQPAESAVTEAGDGFLDVLLAGYEVDGVLAEFIAAEHAMPGMRRFFVLESGKPVAAAAMTVHEDVAVFGGASTLPAHRGRGAQSRLLRHRLTAAAEAGCVLAVATARPGSASAANLAGAGFRLHRRQLRT